MDKAPPRGRSHPYPTQPLAHPSARRFMGVVDLAARAGLEGSCGLRRGCPRRANNRRNSRRRSSFPTSLVGRLRATPRFLARGSRRESPRHASTVLVRGRAGVGGWALKVGGLQELGLFEKKIRILAPKKSTLFHRGIGSSHGGRPLSQARSKDSVLTDRWVDR